MTPGGTATSMGLAKVSVPSAFSVVYPVALGSVAGSTRVELGWRTSWACEGTAARRSNAKSALEREDFTVPHASGGEARSKRGEGEVEG